MVPSLFTIYCVFTVCFFLFPELKLFLFLLFFGLGISCSEESMKALKPGKYSSTSSMVLALLVRLYNFFGNGTHRLVSGSSIDISLQILLWSRSKRNPESVYVMYNL